MTTAELEILVRLGLVELTRTTVSGDWCEYQLTGNGRIMVRQAKPRGEESKPVRGKDLR